jgi:RNA polymerase sigma factor (sigma-70 family)
MVDSETGEFNRWARSRDAEAFQALVSHHAPMVYATCRRVLGDPVEAEDVAQETFEALVKAGREPGRRLGPWLHRVATNLALKRIRSSQRRARRERTYTERLNPMAEHSWDDLYEHVDVAVKELPALQRDAVVAHFLQGRRRYRNAFDRVSTPLRIP